MPLSNSPHVSTRGLIGPGDPWGNFLWRVHVQSCLRRNLENTIGIEGFLRLSVQPCRYCNAQPTIKDWVHKGLPLSKRWPNNSVARIDITQGFTPTNSVTCCRTCSSMKSELNEAEFLFHIATIYCRQVEVLQ